jgi:hypothetical protein
VKGAVTVAFESRKGQSLTVTADIPAGTFAKVYLPAFAYPDNALIVDGASRTGTREGDFVFVDSLPGGHHVVSRGVPVAARPAQPGAPAGTGMAIDAGQGTVRFRLGGGRTGTIFVTVRDIRGTRVGAFALAAAAERTLSLPPGLYVCLAARTGERPAPAKFVVR